MKDAVRDAFYDFNAPMEGAVPWLYQDVKGLVSIGVGILCDPIELAMGLPMFHKDGTHRASQADIAAEWRRIKALGTGDMSTNPAAKHGHRYALPLTTLRLTEAGLRSTLEAKLAQMASSLVNRFPAFELWPCDAQLGVLSLSWACGPAFRFPKLEAALRARDWETSAVECFMPEEKTISGLRPRNKANRLLFRNAAFVEAHRWSYDVLFWPKDLHTSGDTEPPRSAETSRVEVPEVRPDPIEAVKINDFAIVHPPLYPLDPLEDEPPDDDAA